MTALDFLGQVLRTGDQVVFVQKGYRHLVKGTIADITEKTVLICHDEVNGDITSRQAQTSVVLVPRDLQTKHIRLEDQKEE